MPDAKTIREHKSLQIFGTLLHDPNLWHLNRESVARAFAVGLFMAAVPLPSQMILAAAVAIVVRANMPISVTLVWVSNPVTMPPFFYFCYLVGTWVLGAPVLPMKFEITWDWLTTSLHAIWEPFLLGCFIVGASMSVIGYFAMHGFWRWQVVRNWERRKQQREKKKEQENKD